MSLPTHSFVFATAVSRLHADLMIVRLKHAKVPVQRISALYARGSQPNSALTWLNGSARLPLTSGETVTVSGLLRIGLAHDQDHAASRSLYDRLCDLGLAHAQGAAIEEALLESRIVIAIEVRQESELPEIFQVLHGLSAENIFTVDADHRFGIPLPVLAPRRSRRLGLPAFPAFAAFA